MKNDDPYGDEGGARVGKPDTPRRDNLEGGGDGGDLGAGKEATGGIAKHGNAESADKSRAEPIKREQPHDPGYGGNRGGPKTPNDPK